MADTVRWRNAIRTLTVNTPVESARPISRPPATSERAPDADRTKDLPGCEDDRECRNP